MKKIFIILAAILILSSVFLAGGAFADDGSITLNITGFRNDNGNVKIALFSSSDDGFPFDSSKAFKTFEAPIKNGSSSIIMKDIPYGIYSISLYHDNDLSGKLPKSFFGKPLKGIGISNNPPKRNRPPRFDEAKFTLNSDNMTMEINVIYY